MKDKKHILFIHHGRGIGGAPISMRNLLSEIILLPNIKVSILFMFDSDAVGLYDHFNCDKIVLNKPYFYFNHTSRYPKWYRMDRIIPMFFSWFYTAFFKAPQILRKINPDLLYLNSSVLTDWSFTAMKLKIKNIMHIREAIANGHLGIRYKLVKSMIEKYPDRRIFISQENMIRLKIEASETSVLAYNDIGEQFDTFDIKTNIFSPSNMPLKVGFLGGMSKIKGLKTLVDSIPYLDENIHIYIAGHINENQYMAKFGNLNENSMIVGLVENVSKFFKEIDVLVSPITTTHFSRPVIEAAAIGKTAILPDLEGMNEMIEDNNTGLLYRRGEAEDLAKKINLFNRDRTLVKKYGRNARMKYETDFARKRNIDKIIKVFTDLLYD